MDFHCFGSEIAIVNKHVGVVGRIGAGERAIFVLYK